MVAQLLVSNLRSCVSNILHRNVQYRLIKTPESLFLGGTIFYITHSFQAVKDNLFKAPSDNILKNFPTNLINSKQFKVIFFLNPSC